MFIKKIFREKTEAEITIFNKADQLRENNS